MSAKNFRAFTLKSEKPLRFINVEVGITHVNDNEEEDAAPKYRKYTAYVDTSTPHSQLSAKVIEDLSLQAETKDDMDIYHADFYLPNNIRIKDVPARQMKRHNDNGRPIDCVVGMDILSCGDISLSGQGRKTMFSFRVPALGAEDYVETHRRLHKGKMITTAATRNGPCPCGSGKKYKNCCGKLFH